MVNAFCATFILKLTGVAAAWFTSPGWLAVMVAAPADKICTCPEAFTAATAGLLLT